MDKSDLQEVLAALYLRLNGYLASGYIAHARVGNLTEIDIIAVRFPGHKEPEREVSPCKHLRPPDDRVDFVVAEVKGGKKNANFNPKFRERPEAIRKVLHRLGAFSDQEIEVLDSKDYGGTETAESREDVRFPVAPGHGPTWSAALRSLLARPDPRLIAPSKAGDLWR